MNIKNKNESEKTTEICQLCKKYKSRHFNFSKSESEYIINLTKDVSVKICLACHDKIISNLYDEKD